MICRRDLEIVQRLTSARGSQCLADVYGISQWQAKCLAVICMAHQHRVSDVKAEEIVADFRVHGICVVARRHGVSPEYVAKLAEDAGLATDDISPSHDLKQKADRLSVDSMVKDGASYEEIAARHGEYGQARARKVHGLKSAKRPIDHETRAKIIALKNGDQSLSFSAISKAVFGTTERRSLVAGVLSRAAKCDRRT